MLRIIITSVVGVLMVIGTILTATMLYNVSSQQTVSAESPKPQAQAFAPAVYRTPDRPELGMRLSQVMKVCGSWTRSSLYQSTGVDRFVVYYKDTPKNLRNNCNGYFVFEDFVLVSTYQN